ncbi:type II secretion system protein GspL [Cellvibrio japonicus]|uniref:Type II secretion system protein L n=1 Tax=Cellvibrio japonicus (strain Ueda107) TaxID=498211 RepID=B3PF10_CELJU|nr:type II secretion system protein GspL [Cellvibrio japonicus]ACE82842.1 General secretion pathway protein L [Cellvibrio japonicus Ueda107]QEI13573.1 general secretion pathway protein GspL [Cellvibrio japonicus]QEI17147.1 general secretion pathway protein GspL [Cellvibrio japonicus]QEI20724.1 general secretion pathway protein GspL [Cellvibrio japonicus]
MSMQLVLSITTSEDGKGLGDFFRWCWLGADGQANADSGDRDALRTAILQDANPKSAWLIVPGSRVATRALEYSDKEKKHLRNLLPYQLEDTVIGDVEDFHFALSTPRDGHVTLAYTDKNWLHMVFAELASLGLEITRCWSAPMTLPLVKAEDTDSGAPDQAIAEHWTLGLYQGQLLLRHNAYQGFSASSSYAPLALQLLLNQRESSDLPALHLRAASEAELDSLRGLLPSMLQGQIASQQIADEWALDFGTNTIDLCQADFSQRLPVERWWKLWKSVAIFAGVCLLVYFSTALFEIRKLGKENLAIRQDIEAAARLAIPQGRIVDAEKQLTGLLRQMEPAQASGSVMTLLAKTLPQIAALSSVQIKGVAYSSETGELNINIQADSFSTFETLSSNIQAQGLAAELLSANVQGNVQTARLKVSKQ